MSATLDDRLDIIDTLNRYATGIDGRDWALYRSIFADDVAIDFESFRGMAPSVMSGDDWVARVSSGLPGFEAMLPFTDRGSPRGSPTG